MYRYFPRKWSPVSVVIAGAVLVLVPAIIYGVPSNLDLLNHFRFTLPFYDSIRAGDLYPGWLAQSNGGYGDPSFRFYPPGLYYLLAAARALTGNWYAATLSVFILLSVTGGLGVYFWARAFFPRGTALWAGLFYTFAPYHLNDLYQACLLAEYAGCAVLPFCFAFVERVCRKRRAADVAGLAVSFAILILTHLPLAVIGSLSLFVYALLRVEREKMRATLTRLALASMLGLAASSCYWLTMVTELSWIKNEDPSVSYRANFLFSTFSPENVNVWWMNILAFATIAMFLPASALLLRRATLQGEPGSRGVKVVALLFLFSFLMATPISKPLWLILPRLKDVQFPWRWLAVVSMAGAVLVAPSIPFWVKTARGQRRPLALLAAGGVLLSLALIASHSIREAQYLTGPQFEATLQSIPGSTSINNWLPIWASDRRQEMTSAVEAGQRPVTLGAWEAEHRTFEVGPGARTEARVRTFYYPHWVATAEGRDLPTRPAEDGALLVQIPAHAVSVDLQFREPLRTHVAAALSALGWILIVALLVFGLRERHSREYHTDVPSVAAKLS